MHHWGFEDVKSGSGLARRRSGVIVPPFLYSRAAFDSPSGVAAISFPRGCKRMYNRQDTRIPTWIPPRFTTFKTINAKSDVDGCVFAWAFTTVGNQSRCESAVFTVKPLSRIFILPLKTLALIF